MIAICGKCGRQVPYGTNSDRLESHRCRPSLPTIDQIVEADYRECARIGHRPGPICSRCHETIEEPESA